MSGYIFFHFLHTSISGSNIHAIGSATRTFANIGIKGMPVIGYIWVSLWRYRWALAWHIGIIIPNERQTILLRTFFCLPYKILFNRRKAISCPGYCPAGPAWQKTQSSYFISDMKHDLAAGYWSLNYYYLNDWSSRFWERNWWLKNSSNVNRSTVNMWNAKENDSHKSKKWEYRKKKIIQNLFRLCSWWRHEHQWWVSWG